MENIKNWLLSKTIWGIIAMIVPNAQEIYAAIVSQLNSGDFVQIIQAVISILGVVLAIYGRFSAKKKLSFKIDKL
jgi:hypothetical protein